MHPAPLWSVPHAWDGRTCAADLYQKIQALSSLQVQLLAHQDTDVDSHAGIEFSFCDCRGAWRVTVSGLGHRASWRMCPEASRLVVAHGQEPLVPHSCSLVPAQHVQHLAGPWGWPERAFSPDPLFWEMC